MFGAENKREFQQGMDQTSLRRAREQDRLSLRRKKREEQLQRKRRQIMSSSSYSNGLNNNVSSNNHNHNVPEQDINHSQLASTDGIDVTSIIVDKLNEYIQEIKSSNLERRIHGTMCIRILLSKADNQPPYKQVIKSGIVPTLLSFFRFDQAEKLQFEAAWAVTNLLSADIDDVVTFVVQKCNAIQAFHHLLTTTKHFEIMEQAVWGLGNIAGDSQIYRNMLIKNKVFDYLLNNAEQFLKRKNYTLCRNAIWCLSNLVRYDGIGLDKGAAKNGDGLKEPTDLPPWDKIKKMIPIFNKLLNEIGGKIKQLKIEINSGMLQSTDPEYVQCLQCCSDCLWTIQYTTIYMDLSPKSTYLHDIFVQSNLIDIIILFMSMDSVILLSPSLRIMGTFLSGEDEMTERILEKGYLKAAMLNLQCKVRMIRKEVCWTLSNIAGCEKEIAVKIIKYENGQLLKSIVNTCLYDDDQVKKEAGWVLANIVSLSDPEIIHFMVQKGVIGALRAVMKTSSVKKPLITCMEAFDVIMSHTKARDHGPYDYITKVEECGCLDIFDILQAGVDDTDKVYTTSAELVAKYWPEQNGGTQIWSPQNNYMDSTHETSQRLAAEHDADDHDDGDSQADDEEDDDDDVDLQPVQNGNQFSFGLSNQNNTNNVNNNNGNNGNDNNHQNGNDKNGGNKPFQF